MRAAVFVAPSGPPAPVSEDPADIFEHGCAPRHHIQSSVFQNGARLKGSRVSSGLVLVRLPRRLAAIRSAEDAIRWIRGWDPVPSPVVPGLTAAGSGDDRWERAYPRRGLGRPKPLPRRRVRRVPLTARALRERVAKLEAAGYRPMADGYFHQQLTMEEIFEVRADTEYLLIERGSVNALPDGCYGEIGNIRIYLRPSMSDVFGARMRQFGEAAGNALNDLARRRLLERRDEFARVRPALDLAIQAIERSALGLVEGRVLSEIWQMTIGEQLAGIGHRTLYERGVTDVRLDVRLVNDPHSRGLVDPARPTLGLQIWPRWLVP